MMEFGVGTVMDRDAIRFARFVIGGCLDRGGLGMRGRASLLLLEAGYLGHFL